MNDNSREKKKEKKIGGFTLEGLWSRSKLIGRLYRSRLLRCIAFRNKASIKKRVQPR